MEASMRAYAHELKTEAVQLLTNSDDSTSDIAHRLGNSSCGPTG